eukprot:5560221-Amphidinium_carterae.1
MYALIGMFPLNFQKELMTYYDKSIAYMCDTPEDYRKMQHHFKKIDVEYGCPNTLEEASSQVIPNWSRWAQAKALNAACFREDSYKWLLEKEVTGCETSIPIKVVKGTGWEAGSGAASCSKPAILVDCSSSLEGRAKRPIKGASSWSCG